MTQILEQVKPKSTFPGWGPPAGEPSRCPAGCGLPAHPPTGPRHAAVQEPKRNVGWRKPWTQR